MRINNNPIIIKGGQENNNLLYPESLTNDVVQILKPNARMSRPKGPKQQLKEWDMGGQAENLFSSHLNSIDKQDLKQGEIQAEKHIQNATPY